ncbi:hypothetical protein L6452_26624 [Arctium lappa]|uniref:Uncharacterized protein n=1 Tax=Arctium lappa TaxID=4217 RepID=A0ACB8ZVF2_ARCLA|nr:hypothetical protein L6452_26624 [Arctium lappa]
MQAQVSLRPLNKFHLKRQLTLASNTGITAKGSAHVGYNEGIAPHGEGPNAHQRTTHSHNSSTGTQPLLVPTRKDKLDSVSRRLCRILKSRHKSPVSPDLNSSELRGLCHDSKSRHNSRQPKTPFSRLFAPDSILDDSIVKLT